MSATRPKTLVLAALVLLLSSAQLSTGARRRMELYHPDPADMLSYHNGSVLHADIFVSVLWYGSFTQVQKAIIYDFLLSLTTTPQAASPSVAEWWDMIDQQYLSKAAQAQAQATPDSAGGGATKQTTRVMLDTTQVSSDDGCSMGTSLTLAQVSALAARARPRKGGVALVLTAQDVAVEGFCTSQCGLHGAGADAESGAAAAYVWVGNSAAQCPGQCAWPFHQPEYGPQTPPLVPPNGDAAVDGMVVSLATAFAGVVTNPFRDAYYQGSSDAPLEAATACPGQFGSGSYPGYPGNLKIDQASGASYNANGAQGRKYLLPALYNPSTSACSTLV